MDSKVYTEPAEKETGALSPVNKPEHFEAVNPVDKQPNAAVNAGELGSDSEKGLETGQQPTRMTWKTVLVIVALSGIYAGSQIPLYFVGGTLKFISADFGGATASAWLGVAYGVSASAVALFTGYLGDILGRRYITLVGSFTLMMGCLILGTAHQVGQGITGMCFAGAGAAIGELSALAGTAELVPVNKRGFYLAFMTAILLPFTPYLLYSQLLGDYHTWRWGMWITIMWNGLWWIILAVVYFPESQTRDKGQEIRKVMKKVDYIGAVLSIIGLVLFLVALQAGGYSHPWESAYVLCNLFIGILLMTAFVIWEWKYAPMPMIPHELFAGQRIVAMAYGIAFIAGMNFYAMLNFLPALFSSVYDPDPIAVGIKGFATGLCSTAGAVFFNAALSWFKGKNRELLLLATVLMTVFSGAMAAVTPDTSELAVGLGAIAFFGVGGVLVPAATIAITVAPDTVIATTVALSLTVRAIGGSIGYAIYYNIFINKLTPKLPVKISEYAIAAGLNPKNAELFVTTYLTAPAEIAKVPGVTAEIITAAGIGSRWAYSESLKYVWLASIPFGVIAITACLFIGSISKYMTSRVAAKIKQ